MAVSSSKGEDISISETTQKNVFSQKTEAIFVSDSVIINLGKAQNEAVSISENLSTMIFSEKSDSIGISELVIITIESGSNIVNGSQINGAII